MRPSRVEVMLIVGAALNALAELSDLLPPNISGKLTAALLAAWAILRFLLRLKLMQVPASSISDIEELRKELDGLVKEMKAKRATPGKQ